MSNNDVNHFQQVTGSDTNTAKYYISKNKNNVQAAITEYLLSKQRKVFSISDLVPKNSSKKGQAFYAGGGASGIEYYQPSQDSGEGLADRILRKEKIKKNKKRN